MGRSTVANLRTLFLNAVDDGDKMCSCWGGLCHNNEYLTTKKFALTNVFGTERVIVKSAFQRLQGSGFLT